MESGNLSTSGFNFLHSYTLYRLMDLLDEKKEVVQIFVEGGDENAIEDLTVIYADGSIEIVEVKSQQSNTDSERVWTLREIVALALKLSLVAERQKRKVKKFTLVAYGIPDPGVQEIQVASRQIREGTYPFDSIEDLKYMSELIPSLADEDERYLTPDFWNEFLGQLHIEIREISAEDYQARTRAHLIRYFEREVIDAILTEFMLRLLNVSVEKDTSARMIDRSILEDWANTWGGSFTNRSIHIEEVYSALLPDSSLLTARLQWRIENLTVSDFSEEVTKTFNKLSPTDIDTVSIVSQEERDFIERNLRQLAEDISSPWFGIDIDEYLNQVIKGTALEDPIFNADTPSKEDLFGGARQGFANALGIKLSRFWRGMVKATDRSFQIHLHGEWGSGKTTMLNFLANALQPDEDKGSLKIWRQNPLNPKLEEKDLRWIIVRFNAWQHQHILPVFWPVMDQVFRQSVSQLISYYRNFGKAFWLFGTEWVWRIISGGQISYFFALIIFGAASVFLIPIVLNAPVPSDSTPILNFGNVSTALVSIISFAGTIWAAAMVISKTILLISAGSAEAYLKLGRDPLETIRKHYGKMLQRIHRPVIVYIDDLDRCNQEYVVSLFEALNNLFSNARAFYLVAGDRDWLYACFEVVYGDLKTSLERPGRGLGYLFLQKSFQLSFKVPEIDQALIAEYVNSLSHQTQQEMEEQIERENSEHEGAFDSAKSEEEVNERLQAVLAEPSSVVGAFREQAIRAAAIEKRAEKVIEQASEAYLSKYSHLLDPNPRAIKRLVNAYGVYGDLALLAKIDIYKEREKEQFVRWLILFLRWPYLADYLEAHPEYIDHFAKEPDEDAPQTTEIQNEDDTSLAAVLIKQLQIEQQKPSMPGSLQGLVGDESLMEIMINDAGEQLITADVIRKYKGIAGL